MAPLYYAAVAILFTTVSGDGMFHSHPLGPQSQMLSDTPLSGNSAPGSVWPKPQQSSTSDMVRKNLNYCDVAIYNRPTYLHGKL